MLGQELSDIILLLGRTCICAEEPVHIYCKDSVGCYRNFDRIVRHDCQRAVLSARDSQAAKVPAAKLKGHVCNQRATTSGCWGGATSTGAIMVEILCFDTLDPAVVSEQLVAISIRDERPPHVNPI